MVMDSIDIIKLVPVLKENRANLIEELTPIVNSDCLEHLQSHLLTLEDDFFLIQDPFTANIQGCVLIKKYDRMDQAQEIVTWLKEPLDDADQYKEILRKTIKIIESNYESNQAVLKIEETRKSLIESVEALGFTKEGLFISNRFLKGEFSFYSVYTYKLQGIKEQSI